MAHASLDLGIYSPLVARNMWNLSMKDYYLQAKLQTDTNIKGYILILIKRYINAHFCDFRVCLFDLDLRP